MTARTQGAAEASRAWLGKRTSGEFVAAPAVPAPVEGQGDHSLAATVGRSISEGARPALAPAHTDWLFHHLRVEGPEAALAAFRATAAGAGIISWHLDLDRVEEDAFLRLAAPNGQARTLSLEGARMLAAELRDAVARRHALAVARVGRDQTAASTCTHSCRCPATSCVSVRITGGAGGAMDALGHHRRAAARGVGARSRRSCIRTSATDLLACSTAGRGFWDKTLHSGRAQ